ncbi:MAG TPA: DEAD/DEAH box helicase [Candidatus Thermoplasmatota archaeon]|nr:DEAD/DEAH box helicase [Candidatus Thermoplasmatota archaeon]
MHALSQDARLRHVPAERWERAERLRARGWLRDARLAGTHASATCAGLVGVRPRVDLATLACACDCGAELPCEHVLALLMEFPPAPPPPPPPPAPLPVESFVVSSAPDDPGTLVLAGDGGLVPDAAAERLRWVWWRRLDAARLAGEPKTLAQALQLLTEAGLASRGASFSSELAGACALFRQRALGDAVHVRVLDAASDASLALARMLADRGARPAPGRMPAELWTLDDATAFAGFYLQAWRGGAEVRADLTLNPKPLEGVEAQLDVGCLPVRLSLDPAHHGALTPLLRGAPVLDPKTGHVLVPATRAVDVEEGLRALGVDVCYHRLAPAGEKYLEWPEELPEDLHGSRPRLRAPFAGTLAARPPGLREATTLAPYQEQAVAFIAHHEHTCLLADDMGLGKTLEAIASAQLVEGRVLVVCPASARQVWEHEVAKFTTEAAIVVGPGEDGSRGNGPEKYVVTGYSNLEAMAPALDIKGFAMVILDESHYVKNAATARSRSVTERLHVIPRRLVISGTPVMNTPEEVRAQLAFLHPEEWSDAKWFGKRFVEPFDGGTPEVREAVLKRLRQFLEGVMLRREKSEALPELPAKTIQWHRLALVGEARRAYVALEDEFDEVARAEGAGSAKAGGKLERLRQCAVSGKLPHVEAFVRETVARGEKVVLFSKYRDALKSLAADLAELGAVSLTGDSTPEERAEAERRFQEDPACRVFLGQIVAAGTALTLIAGTHAVFLDLSWNPADHRQAMDRIHRRGQTRPVTAHFFLAEQTVDEDMALVLDAKGQMMDALLRGRGAAVEKGAKRAVAEKVMARRAAA